MENDVDTGRYAAAVYDVPGQAAWRVQVGGRYLLATGGIAPEHGSIDLLEAHGTLVQEHGELADLHLVIAGHSPAADAAFVADFLQRAVALGTDPHLLVSVADADLPALVAGAAAFGFLPTRDTSCGPALQALAAAVPVVARDLPSIRAVLHDVVAYGDTVLSIADALVDVLTDPPEADAGIALAASYGRGESEDGVVE